MDNVPSPEQAKTIGNQGVGKSWEVRLASLVGNMPTNAMHVVLLVRLLELFVF